MTQWYEPIELTDDMPEPKDEGTYFLFSENISRYLMPIFHDGDYWELADTTCSWSELIGGRNKQERITIQSLAAHDAQMRAGALEFTNEERDLMLKSALDFTETDDAQEVDEMIAAIIGSVVEHRKEQK